MRDQAHSRPLRILLAILLVSLAWAYAQGIASELAGRHSAHAVAVRAPSLRPTAGRAAPDLSGTPTLPEPGFRLSIAEVERRVERVHRAEEVHRTTPRRLRELPRGPPSPA